VRAGAAPGGDGDRRRPHQRDHGAQAGDAARGGRDVERRGGQLGGHGGDLLSSAREENHRSLLCVDDREASAPSAVKNERSISYNRAMSPTARDRPARRSEARERLLATASQLFYAEGINSVGVDRIVS